MPHRKNAVSNESIAVESQSFFHPGISYDPKTHEVTLNDEAKIAFQSLATKIQSSFPNVQEPNTEVTKLTVEISQDLEDIMLIVGKKEEKIIKFAKKVMLLLSGKPKKREKWELRDNLNKEIIKYTYVPWHHIYIQYRDGNHVKTIDNVPLIIRPNFNIDDILSRFNARLKFDKIINTPS